MDETTRTQLTKTLFRALEGERTGQHFYRMAAAATEDGKGRDTFEKLADEEKLHEEFLAGQIRALGEKGEVDATIALGSPGDFSGDSPVFSQGLVARAGQAHAEMSALGVGVQIELSSVQFYREQAEQAADPAVKGFLQSLADWESVHYNALLKQQETLKEAYWADNRFAPF